MDFILRYLRDPPAAVIKARAEAYKAAPPENWDGVYSFSTK